MAAIRKTLARRLALFLRQSAAPAPAGRPCPLLQKRPFFQPALPPDRGTAMLLAGERLGDRIRGLSPARVRLEGILPPAEGASKDEEAKGVRVEELRKVVRASHVAAARARLAATGKSCVPYAEFVRACCDTSGGEQGLEIARSLDESGVVIVLGDVVFLKPEEVARTIESMIPSSLRHQDDLKREELLKMEEKKCEIDKIAAAQVRKELWCGLGFMVAQTAALMRVTFWELSWDVMEPICFYLTSIYFLAGYAFFLRTSKEPSFESFFASRFAAKQRRLMEAHEFDLKRFNELSQACQRPLPPGMQPSFTPPSSGLYDRKIPFFVGSTE